MTTIRVRVGEHWYTVEVGDLGQSPVRVTVDGEVFEVDVEAEIVPTPPRRGRPAGGFTVPDAPTPAPSGSAAPIDDDILRSPMPGRVMSILVRPGDTVSAGDEVCVVEAMKMEQSILAHRNGVVKTVFVQPLDSVNANDPLVELE
ncbi:MAG: acetyl-CoA carboxylase biotin carboxyl carrier protein subunit [Chloroflexota bacterium]|nr:acetyl-CoA carboxylase biotin carboxyl carrier protein subunit [Chloroflexota bacterium]MDE2685227.1 acetyl-CoA carboxylase biotin carboxyl carrier protein subunit [Chloroflexota bacterium]